MNLNVETLLYYQEYWKESKNLTDKQKQGYIILSNKLIERAKENNGEVDDVVLYYPEDYSDSRVFLNAYAMNTGCFISKRTEGGLEMHDFGLICEINVE